MKRRIDLNEGKYTIYLSENGLLTFYRNGEPWPGGQEAFQFANVVGALAHRVAELEDEIAALVHPHDLLKYRSQK